MKSYETSCLLRSRHSGLIKVIWFTVLHGVHIDLGQLDALRFGYRLSCTWCRLRIRFNHHDPAVYPEVRVVRVVG